MEITFLNHYPTDLQEHRNVICQLLVDSKIAGTGVLVNEIGTAIKPSKAIFKCRFVITVPDLEQYPKKLVEIDFNTTIKGKVQVKLHLMSNDHYNELMEKKKK